jgi:hypothetical protein
LIETETEQVSAIVVDATGSQIVDPKIEERQVSQNAIEKLGRERAIERTQIACRQTSREDRIRELPARAPLPERVEGECA